MKTAFNPLAGQFQQLPDALDVGVDAAAFAGNLSSADSSVQAALATLDSNLITSNLTITVKASGGDFTTIQAALNSITKKFINAGVMVTISVDPGLFTHTSPIDINHPNAARITIIGATPVQTTMTSVASASGSSGNYTVVLNVASSAGMAIGDYVIICTSTGTGAHRAVLGCWEVLDIPSVSQITVKNSYRRTAWPTLTITGGTVRCLKTILKFNGCDGIDIGSAAGYFRNLAIVGNGAGTADGINISQHGSSFGGSVAYFGSSSDFNVGVNGFSRYGLANTSSLDLNIWNMAISNCGQYGFYCYSQAKIAASGLIASGNVNIGVYAADGAFITAVSSFACGNATVGFYAYNRSGINAQYSESVGNLYSGFQASATALIDNRSGKSQYNGYHGYSIGTGSTGYVTSSNASYNGAAANYYGYYCNHNSTMRADSTTATGNFTGDYRAEDNSYIKVTGYVGSPTFSPAVDVVGNSCSMNRSVVANVVEFTNTSSVVGTTVKDALNTLLNSIKKFQSTVQTETGASQSIAHGLGATPTLVLVSVYDTATLGNYVISEGTHDATNVNVTVTTNVKYKVIAFV